MHSQSDTLKPLAAAWEQVADCQAQRAELLGQLAGFDCHSYEMARNWC